MWNFPERECSGGGVQPVRTKSPAAPAAQYSLAQAGGLGTGSLDNGGLTINIVRRSANVRVDMRNQTN